MTPSLRLGAYLLSISALWGSCFPLIRVLARSLPPFTLSTARGALAALTLLLWLASRGELARLDRTAMRHAAVLGTLNGWVPNVLVAASLGRIESAPAALIQAAGPLVTLLLSLLLLREERPGGGLAALRLACGFGLGFLGVLLVLLLPLAQGGGGGGATLAGGLLMAAAGVSYAFGTIYGRWARIKASAPVVLGQQVASALPSLGLALLLEPFAAWDQAARVWGLVALLAIIGSALPLTLFLHLLSFARARDAALVGYLQPLWAVALASLLLGERPSLTVLIGGAIVLLGVWLAGRAPERRA